MKANRLKLFYIYWRGRLRLAQGFCPWCNSSPPDIDCPICYGSYDYGPPSDPRRLTEWRVQWDFLIKGDSQDE